MKVLSTSLKLKDHTRARTFPNIPAESSHKGFNVRKENTSPRGDLKNGFKNPPVLCPHLL